MITVRFRSMWAGFNPAHSSIMELLRAALGSEISVVRDTRAKVHIEVASVYPSRGQYAKSLIRSSLSRVARTPQDIRDDFEPPGKSANAELGIWYTPENRRPPSSGWDLTLSFDGWDWPANAHLPFWQLNSDLFGRGADAFLGKPLAIEQMAAQRVAHPSTRPGFCCAIIRNPEPTRMTALSLLRKLGPVDVFGLVGARPITSKFDTISNYRFALCFENDLYPGYITEKPFDAWTAGAIPIYWGQDRFGSLNSEAVLNLATMNGFDELLARVDALERDRDLMDFKASMPILAGVPDPAPVLSKIREVAESTLPARGRSSLGES